MSSQSQPENVCIIRLSAIGDVCHTVPVVRTLQVHRPQTQITWIIGKKEASLVEDIPNIEFIIFDKSKGWRAYGDLRRGLGGRRFDWLLLMQPALRASLASLCVRATNRVGFDRPRSRDWQWLFTNRRIGGEQRVHVQDTAFQFLEAMGVAERELRWDIPIPTGARTFCADHLPAGRPVLAINPCSNVRRRNWRNWSAERYAAVADHAAAKFGMMVVLTGGPSPLEEQVGKEIENRCESSPINLIGKTTLKQLLAVLDRADVLIAPDTGPAHMATAVGTPVIGLYATTNPDRARAYLSEEWVVNKYPEALRAEYGIGVHEAPWGARVRRRDAMLRIQTRDVIDRLDAFMSQRNVSASAEDVAKPS